MTRLWSFVSMFRRVLTPKPHRATLPKVTRFRNLACLLTLAGLIPGCTRIRLAAPEPVRPAAYMAWNTVWEGTVEITENVLVPAGVTLTIKPGTVVKFAKAKQSQVDPRFLFIGNQLLIRGNIQAAGTLEQPIVFTSDEPSPQAGDWAGIILDHIPAGTGRMAFCQIQYAETGIYCISSSPSLNNNLLQNNEHGIVCQREACPEITENQIINGDIGISCWDSSAPLIADNYIAWQKQAGIMCSREAAPWLMRNIIEYNKYGIFGNWQFALDNNDIRQNEQDIYP